MRRRYVFVLLWLGGCAVQVLAATGQRTAIDAARATWFIEQGPSPSACEPSVTALKSAAFEVRCGEATSYVRCEYSSEEPCCWTVTSREQAIKFVVPTAGTLKVCD